jgi:hypothetical protein
MPMLKNDSCKLANWCRTLPGVVLSVYLAAWIGFFTLIPIAHIVFADHGHRYCSEHRQIEDIPRDDGQAQNQLSVHTSSHGSWSVETPVSQSLLHIACSILNYVSSPFPLLHTDQSPTLECSDQPQLLASVRQERLVLRSALLVAPKTSPPSVAD